MEDSPEVREVFTLFLPTLGHWVESAGDVTTALERLSQGGFDVLLTDLWWPNVHGWCLLQELRARGNLPPHVVSTSADIQTDTARLSRAAGCCAHLAQPFWLSEVEQTLAAICRSKDTTCTAQQHTAADLENALLYPEPRAEALRLRTESRLLCAIVARNIASCSQAVEQGRRSRVLLAHGLDAFVDAHPDTPEAQRRGARERILRFFEDTAAGSVRHYVERTSQQQRGQDLLLSEQRRLALDSARMGWWHLDVASGRVDMDARIRAIFDVDETSDAYPQVLQRMHPEDRARVDAAVQAAIRPVDPLPYAVEYRVVRRDGSLRWVAAKGQTYYEGDGAERRAVGFSGTVLDITNEKTAHEALRESEAKYRSIFTSIDQGYCVIEVIFDEARRPVDYLFLEVNPAFVKQTGLQAAVGKRMRELAPAHEVDWFKIYGQVVTTGLPTRFEAEAAALGRWYDVFASRVGQEGEHRVAIAFTDITEQRNSAQALRSKEKTSRFLADLGEATRQTIDPDAVLGVVVDVLQTHLSADRCAYVEVAEDQDTITIRYDRLDPASSNLSLADPANSVTDVCRLLKVSRSTAYRLARGSCGSQSGQESLCIQTSSEGPPHREEGRSSD